MKILRFLCLLLFTASVRADLRSDTPAIVTGYAESSGLMIYHGWKADEKGVWFACSDYMRLSKQEVLPNTLAYYCLGNEQRVTEVRLVLNVLQGLSANEHLASTAEAAARLHKTATGREISVQAKNAILLPRSFKEEAADYTTIVERLNGDNGTYTLRFIIRLTGAPPLQAFVAPGAPHAMPEPFPSVPIIAPDANWWLNTATGERHNSTCRYFKNTEHGKLCTSYAGNPCALCGG